MRVVEGHFRTPERPVALVASRFNGLVVEALVEGARDQLLRHGLPDDQIECYWVPGAFEIGGVAKRLLASGEYAAIIALGCVIRGETPHFDQVVSGVSGAMAQLAATGEIPVIFGVLTTETLEQAQQRAGAKAGNKGSEAAAAALEMIDLYGRLPTP